MEAVIALDTFLRRHFDLFGDMSNCFLKQFGVAGRAGQRQQIAGFVDQIGPRSREAALANQLRRRIDEVGREFVDHQEEDVAETARRGNDIIPPILADRVAIDPVLEARLEGVAHLGVFLERTCRSAVCASEHLEMRKVTGRLPMRARLIAVIDVRPAAILSLTVEEIACRLFDVLRCGR